MTIIIINTGTAPVHCLCVTYKQNKNWRITHQSENGSLLKFFFFFWMRGNHFGICVEYPFGKVFFVFGFFVVFLRRLLYQHSAEIAKIKRGKLLAIDEVIEVKKTYWKHSCRREETTIQAADWSSLNANTHCIYYWRSCHKQGPSCSFHCFRQSSHHQCPVLFE